MLGHPGMQSRPCSNKPYHTSILSGQMWVRELLGGNPQHIKDQLGWPNMYSGKLTLQIASQTVQTHTRHVDLDEQVAIFLYTMVTNLSNRKVAEHFKGVVTPSPSM